MENIILYIFFILKLNVYVSGHNMAMNSLYFLHSKYYFRKKKIPKLILVQNVTIVFMRFSHILPYDWALSRLVRLTGLCEWGLCGAGVWQVTLLVNLLHHHLCSREHESVSIVLLHKELRRLPAWSRTQHFYYTVLMQPKQHAQ